MGKFGIPKGQHILVNRSLFAGHTGQNLSRWTFPSAGGITIAREGARVRNLPPRRVSVPLGGQVYRWQAVAFPRFGR